MIIELAKKLATFAQFVDFVIAELEFQRGKFAAGAEILKTHSAMVLLQVSTPNAKLLVKMIRPRSEIKAAVGCRIQSAEKIWRVFTASEIFSFTQAVGDKNKIHQLNPPIVPGLLILETISAEFSSRRIKMRFKKFITAGEPLSLRVNDNNFEIYSAGERKIFGTAN